MRSCKLCNYLESDHIQVECVTHPFDCAHLTKMVLLAALPINQPITEIPSCLGFVNFLILEVTKLLIAVNVVVDWELLVELLIVVLELRVIDFFGNTQYLLNYEVYHMRQTTNMGVVGVERDAIPLHELLTNNAR